MRAGAPSLNPKGRPPRGQSLAERVRRRVDVDELIDGLANIAADPAAKHADRIAAAREILDRGYGKALASIDVHASAELGPSPELVAVRLAELPLERRAALLGEIRALRALAAGEEPEQ